MLRKKARLLASIFKQANKGSPSLFMSIRLSIAELLFLHISLRDKTDKDPPYKNIQQKDGRFQERSWNGYQQTQVKHCKTQ